MGCDFVGLMEVRGASLGERRTQAQLLGEQAGLSWLYLPSERRWWHDDFGNAALSRFPVTQWERIQISPTGGGSNRNMALITFEVGGRTVRAVVTHLARHDENAPQLSAVIGMFRALEVPAVLLGDLNISDDNPQIRELQKTPGVVDAVSTLPAQERAGHVDWIFLRGLRCVKAGREDKAVSDHPFYWADVEWPE